jgi:HD-GYP domain-containing protein (c-di-GMP phosphodiesterase class II)
MTAVAAHGLPEEVIGRSFRLVDGMAGRVLMTGEPVLTDDYAAYPRRLELFSRESTRGAASVPIRWAGRLRGALTAGSSHPWRRLGPRDLEVLCEVAHLGALALEHAETRQDLESATQAAISALARAAGMRDRRLPGHAERVVELARRVGLELGLAGEEIPELELAARLHDVGKIALPDAILRKPGPLSAREWDAIRRHPEWGAGILVGIHGFEAVAAIVLHHHEHYDGSGYPDGLRGDGIPLASRIVCACSAYGAMVSDRPYRPALRPITALRELQRRSGSQFDPEAVIALTATARN